MLSKHLPCKNSCLMRWKKSTGKSYIIVNSCIICIFITDYNYIFFKSIYFISFFYFSLIDFLFHLYTKKSLIFAMSKFCIFRAIINDRLQTTTKPYLNCIYIPIHNIVPVKIWKCANLRRYEYKIIYFREIYTSRKLMT